MANDPRFEVYPHKQRFFGAKIEHPRHGIVDAEDREEPTGEFGWRFRAANGRIAATSGEGFTRREDAKRAVGDFVQDIRETTYGLRFPESVAASVIDVED